MALLSVILPAYNEEMMVERAGERLRQVLQKEKIKFELIFVDDGSKDATWFKIEEIAKRYDFIRGIHFSRNFGKEAAIFAGLAGRKGIVRLLWIAICSIRRKRSLKCIDDGKRAMKSLKV